MRFWIIPATPVTKENIEFYKTIRPKLGDQIICADGGYDNAILFGMLPHVVIGDMDSLKSTPSKGTKLIKFPTDKDKTDTELAIDYAIENGATEIIILGEQTGSLSHTLANIMLLRYIENKSSTYVGTTFGRLQIAQSSKIESMLLSHKERICLLKNGKTTISRGDSKTLSLIPLTDCQGVTITQTKYEIKNADIPIGSTHLLSNQFTPLNAQISVRSGELLIIAEK